MKIKNVTLRQLRSFVVIAEKGSFVGACDVLGLSQPGLSQAIKQLEDEIGAKLFIRTTRSVRLTPLGMSFLTHVKHLLRQFDQTMDDVQEMVTRKRGKVTIACLPSVASRLMPRLIAINERLHPGIHVAIRDMNMKAVSAAVVSGEADLGIGSAVAENSDLKSAMLARDRFHAVMPLTSPLARQRVVRWKDFADQPFIAMSEETGLRQLVNSAAQQCGAKLKVTAEVTNIATLFGMIEEGIGVSALPGLVLPRGSQSLVRHRVLSDPTIRRTIYLFWRASTGLSPAAEGIVLSLRRSISDSEFLSHFPDVEWEGRGLAKIVPEPARSD
jgi:DNA-binding transcriptional LysR family regulator